MASNFSYTQFLGPGLWSKLYPLADGVRQSPIDICQENCAEDADLKGVTVAYRDMKMLNLENTGASWKVQVASGDSCE